MVADLEAKISRSPIYRTNFYYYFIDWDYFIDWGFEESLVTPEGKVDVILLLGIPEELTPLLKQSYYNYMTACLQSQETNVYVMSYGSNEMF